MFQRDEKQKKKDRGKKRAWKGFILLSYIKYKTATVFTKLTVNSSDHDG